MKAGEAELEKKAEEARKFERRVHELESVQQPANSSSGQKHGISRKLSKDFAVVQHRPPSEQASHTKGRNGSSVLIKAQPYSNKTAYELYRTGLKPAGEKRADDSSSSGSK